MVDNVNLCSPAVLDRLNALLEPGGILTIGERGVGPDGRLVTVCPHPGFRLFLTMDPHNGEISRYIHLLLSSVLFSKQDAIRWLHYSHACSAWECIGLVARHRCCFCIPHLTIRWRAVPVLD
jgi:midasin (ATPase involved in ribosome maturation)